MDRTTLFLIAIAAAAVWVFYKRVIRKEPLSRDRYLPPLAEVERWYDQAAKELDEMDAGTRKDRESRWLAMGESERLAYSDAFMVQHFGPRSVSRYEVKQRLKIGQIQFAISDTD